MKVINKIMIGIAVICLLLCGGILVFALNPDMTDALAQRLYGNGNNAETVTETAEAIGNPSNIGTDGSVSVTLPDQPENSLSDYINPNPQEPLRYPGGNTGSSDSGTAATPAPRSDAVTDLNSYYANCITQLSILGSGDQHFDNVVSKSLWAICSGMAGVMDALYWSMNEECAAYLSHITITDIETQLFTQK